MPKPTILDGGKRNRIQNSSGPVSPISSGSQLGTLRGSQVCPIRENMTRAENNRRREEEMGRKQAVRDTEKNFSTDRQLLMTETTDETKILKTLLCLERLVYQVRKQIFFHR